MFDKTYTNKHGQTVLIRRIATTRKLSLKFHKREKAFIVTVPVWVPLSEIAYFINGADAWFLKTEAIQKNQTPTKIQPGQIINLLGEKVEVQFIESCKVQVLLQNNVLAIYGVKSTFEKNLRNYLWQLAAEKFSHYSKQYAQILNVEIKKIAIKDMKTRYGSCTTHNHLNYCWRVIMAPEAVLDYLCAHEVAHLKEMNHSRAFWSIVKSLCPTFKQHQQWLKEHGKELFKVNI